MKLIKKLCGLFRCPGCGTYYNPTYGKCQPAGNRGASAAGSCNYQQPSGEASRKKGRD